jgi:beta-lactamase class C
MRFLIFLSTLCLSLATYSSTSSDALAQEKMHRFMKRHRVSGAAMIIYSHGQTRTYVFGDAIPSQHVRVTPQTIFELGSITKTFTGLLLAQHVLSGKTQFSEPIHPHLEQPHSNSLAKLTYLQLATHVSGLPFNAYKLPYNAPDNFVNRLRLKYILRKSYPRFYPESQMLYSNFAFSLLGRVIAQKEHTALNQLMHRDILTPLNMHHSGLDISPQQQKYLAQGFTAPGAPVNYQHSGLLAGAWAMRASVADMSHYLRAAVESSSAHSTLSHAMRLAQTPYFDMKSEGMQFGLGWVVTPLNQSNIYQKLILRPEHYHFSPYRVSKIKNPRFNSHTLISKTGATDGFRAYIAVIPEKHAGIVVMINRFTRPGSHLTSMANDILIHQG